MTVTEKPTTSSTTTNTTTANTNASNYNRFGGPPVSQLFNKYIKKKKIGK